MVWLPLSLVPDMSVSMPNTSSQPGSCNRPGKLPPPSLKATVSVINTATNMVVGSPITAGALISPTGVAVTPDGSKVYVTNEVPATLLVINTATNTVIGSPITFGTFARVAEIVIEILPLHRPRTEADLDTATYRPSDLRGGVRRYRASAGDVVDHPRRQQSLCHR
jgi:YVTN family beta-propeller protein